jgi:DNA segregation ATPase FtsK/SpoIIIE, S-DNA-T family
MKGICTPERIPALMKETTKSEPSARKRQSGRSEARRAAPRKTSNGKEQKESRHTMIPWHECLGLIMIAAGFFIMYCIINPQLSGNVGAYAGKILKDLMGWASFSLPFLLILGGARLLYPFRLRTLLFFTIMVLVFVWSIEIMRCLTNTAGSSTCGIALKGYLASNLGNTGTCILLVALMLISTLLFIGMSVRDIMGLFLKIVIVLLAILGRVSKTVALSFWSLIKPVLDRISAEMNKNKIVKRPEREIIEDLKEAARIAENIRIDIGDVEVKKTRPAEKKKEPSNKAEPSIPSFTPTPDEPYKLPAISMLEGIDSSKVKKSTRDYSSILVETLESFGVSASVINIERGPSITRYELQPAKGVKVSKITNLTNDIALVLAAPSIRIEAPVRGKACIGIEIPNERSDMVHVKEILDSDEFNEGKYALPLAFGKDITGKPVVGDLVKMPHLLVAGSTGSGKTVCINCIIASILFNAFPTEVQLVMIDPKRVELSMYEGIPHLIDIKATPDKRIITDPKIATLVLHHMTEIMDSRYDEFQKIRARDIFEYNKKAPQPLPFLVIIVDELADLMMVSSAAVEKHICRLAQMGRAAGIHLILATQRPSVDVITGLIKVNIPSRAAFAVTSQIDSRTILDRAGAEKLLGKGDMLYMPSDAADPRRIQGAFISSEDIENIVAFWLQQPPPENLTPVSIEPKDLASGDSDDGGSDDEDELYSEALRIIMAERQASVSILQRKLKIGYARAGRIIDIMERRGVVGPASGSKSRKILAGSGAEGMQ